MNACPNVQKKVYQSLGYAFLSKQKYHSLEIDEEHF